MVVRRQQQLFAAEDWKVAYKVYSQIDFQAYDFDTMRSAMVEYVRNNFPENFNDYIESSEFIAIIELLAYLSQSLAFRMDVNTRENFLETAERRDSVFKLARMLGYNPKRNLPASGLVKLVSVKTNEPLTDSLGNDLNNRAVYWGDVNNSQSYEQFILILNAAMSKTNRFTSPIKSGAVGGINTDLYQLNTPAGSPISYNFEINSLGTSRLMNVVNADFEDQSHFFERHPDPTNLMNLIYRNDGTGINSTGTGFFFFFRQGGLSFTDYNYTTPLEDRVEDVAIQNINESDVYLQEIGTNGLVLNKWSKVPNTVGQTLNYNSVALNTRDLYAVENLGNDGVRLRFPSGDFGNVPTGLYRMWYRTSDPSTYTIQPEDAKNISISIPYQNALGRNYNLTATFSLQSAVSNSAPAESLDAIKERAPQIFYTQNRMVNAQDYNVYPQSQSTNIAKMKATNRTHAGHSRYIDINDPTGTFHDVDTFADDAYLYTDIENVTEQVVVNSTTPALEVTASIIPNLLKTRPVTNFVYYDARNEWTDPTSPGGNQFNFTYTLAQNVLWNPLPVTSTSKTGYLTEQFTPGITNVLVNTVDETTILKENSFLKFVNPTDASMFKWARVVSVDNNGQLSSSTTTGAGPWTLSEEIDSNWQIVEVIVTVRSLFTPSEASLIEAEINNKRTFALGYHLLDDRWFIIDNAEISATTKTGSYAIESDGEGPNSWLVMMEYTPIDTLNFKYTITARALDYVVQSESKLRFYNISEVKTVNNQNQSSKDTIIFTTVNTKPGESESFFWNGNTWNNDALDLSLTPSGRRLDIPLRTRDTNYQDVRVSWVSNYGILSPVTNGGASPTLANYVARNEYVTDAIIPLVSFFQVGGISTETNVVIANNSGRITSLPNNVTIPFNNNTFGTNIVDTNEANAFIGYRQVPDNGAPGSELIFRANIGGEIPNSYGVNGDTLDANTTGRLYFVDYNEITETGNLQYRNIQNNDFHYSQDRTAVFQGDKMVLQYENNKEGLDQEISWEIIGAFKETDGYVDSRKVKVTPLDTDGDLIPDRPRQFDEYVDVTDYVFFETFTDFDGFQFDRPVSNQSIVDYRFESSLTIDNSNDRISAGSYTKWITMSTIDWIIVNDLATAALLENQSNLTGARVFVLSEDTTYILIQIGTAVSTIELAESTKYFAKRGRGKTQSNLVGFVNPSTIRWKHNAPQDIRIDPSISNVVEMTVLTQSYLDQVNSWLARPTGEFPLEPTSDQLSAEFYSLNTAKSASDTLIFRSGKFKLLFGDQAATEYKATFRVVKLSDQLSDNELKTNIISAINLYFDVTNWDFGESFYFTELSTFIHQRLGSAIGSIVILPKSSTGKFGEIFQVTAEPNEFFLSTASVSDIEIISRIDNQTLLPSS